MYTYWCRVHQQWRQLRPGSGGRHQREQRGNVFIYRRETKWPHAIFLHDAEGRLLDVNERACASLGYSRAELLRLRVTDVEADFSPEAVRQVSHQLQTGEFKIVAGQHRRKDGTTFPVEVSLGAYCLRDQELIMALVRDVTDRRDYAEKMARSVSLLRATIESSASGILAVNTDGKIAAYNQRFLQLWNLSEALAAAAQDEELLGHARRQLADPEAAARRVREIYAQPEAESFDTLIFKDGRVFERSSRPQRLGETIIGRVWSFWDITERRRAETALRPSELRSAKMGMLKVSPQDSW